MTTKWALIIRGTGPAFSQSGNPNDVEKLAQTFVQQLYAAGHSVLDGRAFAGMEKDLREETVTGGAAIQEAAAKVFNGLPATAHIKAAAFTDATTSPGKPGDREAVPDHRGLVLIDNGVPRAAFSENVRSLKLDGPQPSKLTEGTVVRDTATKQLGVVLMVAGSPGIPDGYAVAFEASADHGTFRWEKRDSLEVIAIPSPS